MKVLLVFSQPIASYLENVLLLSLISPVSPATTINFNLGDRRDSTLVRVTALASATFSLYCDLL